MQLNVRLHTNSALITMKVHYLFDLKLIAFAVIFGAFIFGASAAAQPRQERLLNGLKILMWRDYNAKDVSIRLRINSGAAFDPQGKEGVMRLTADSIFPNQAAREYFRDELGGGLDVVTNYDYIEIDASGRSDTLLQLLETVAAAVSSQSIDKEVTSKLKQELTAEVSAAAADPAKIADAELRKRLFGTFPYGRPMNGSPESIAKIDFADLINAKLRFLTADNSTLAISGNFDPSFAVKASRRLFGSWAKADKTVPPTFKQPDDPPKEVQTVTVAGASNQFVRYGLRGVSRSDKDFGPAMVLARIMKERTEARSGRSKIERVFAEMQPHVLPGAFFLGFTMPNAGIADSSLDMTNFIKDLLSAPITDTEIAAARDEFRKEWAKNDAATLWLDSDTFKTGDAASQAKIADAVTFADVRAVADRVAKEPVAAVIVKGGN